MKNKFREPSSSPFACASRFSTKPKHLIAVSGQGIGDDKLAILGNGRLRLPDTAPECDKDVPIQKRIVVRRAVLN